MGKSLFIVLAVCLMYSGVQGESESMSCSMVNGQMICNKEKSSGNTAMASSSAFSGPQGSDQQTYAGAGNPGGQWGSSGQRVVSGNVPGRRPAPSNDYFDFDRTEFQAPPRRFDGPVDGACRHSTSGSPENYGPNAVPKPVVGGFGFASAGNVPPPQFPFHFVPRIPNTSQDFSQSNGGLPIRNNFNNNNSGYQGSTRGFGGLPVQNNFGNSGFQGSSRTFGAFPVRNNFDNNNSGFQGSTGRIVGGPPVGGMSYSYASSGPIPNSGTNVGPMNTAGGFGYASAGNVASPPGFPFNYVSGFANGQQSSSRANGGGMPAGGGAFAGGFAGAGPMPGGPVPGVPFDPFRFVFGGRR